MNPAVVIRRAQAVLDHLHQSHTTVLNAEIGYGKEGRSQLKTEGDLGKRTDEHGNIEPYASDDEAVLRRLFHLEPDDWQSLG